MWISFNLLTAYVLRSFADSRGIFASWGEFLQFFGAVYSLLVKPLVHYNFSSFALERPVFISVDHPQAPRQHPLPRLRIEARCRFFFVDAQGQLQRRSSPGSSRGKLSWYTEIGEVCEVARWAGRDAVSGEMRLAVRCPMQCAG
jgi:hypothetical protein